MKTYSVYSLILACVCLFLAVPQAQATGVAGQCGPAHGGNFSTAPSDKAQLCNRGVASGVSSSSTTHSWTCAGTGTSGNANCSAMNCGSGPSPVNGVCNNSSRNACSAGTPNDGAIADTSTYWRWRCDGQNGGSNSGTCQLAIPPSPINGVCKSISGNHTSEPATNTSNACNAGTFTDLSDTSSQWRWRCDGQSGGSNSGTCTANRVTPVNGVCKTISGTHSSEPATNTSNACNAGTFTDLSDTSSQWRWRCDGQDGGSNSGTCTANRTPAGTCKSYSGTWSGQPGSDDDTGCTAGTYADTGDTSTEWRWTCGAATCSADKCATPPTFQGTWRTFGTTSNSYIFPSGKNYPPRNNCAAGETPSALIDDYDGKYEITEDDWSGGDRTQYCMKTSNSAITVTSEWRSGSCSSGMTFTGITDDDCSDIGEHGLPEEDHGSCNYRWCVGLTGTGSSDYQITATRPASTSCGSNGVRVVTTTAGKWDVNNEDGSQNYALCLKIDPKATCQTPPIPGGGAWSCEEQYYSDPYYGISYYSYSCVGANTLLGYNGTATTPTGVASWTQTAPTTVSPYSGPTPSSCTLTGSSPRTWNCN